MSATEKLAILHNEMALRGLLDVQFSLSNRKEAAPELVCLEVNRLYEAIENGDYVELKFNDSYMV